MKKLFFLLLIFTSSCLDSAKTLPSSIGSFPEVIFVVEDNLWRKGIKEAVTETFGAPIKGVYPDEASFRVIHVTPADFKAIFKKHPNIVIIEKDVKPSSQKNKWTNAQLVETLNYKKEDIKNKLNEIKEIFESKELKSIKNKISKTSQQLPQKNIYQNFKIELLVPSEYTIYTDTSTFFWAAYDPNKQDVIKHLLVFSFIPKTTNLQEQVLQKIDSVFRKYIQTRNKEGTFASIEPRFPPSYFNNTYRGWWTMENDFKAGPFLVKTYSVNGKIVVAVGLVFDPSSRKRKYLKTFEAIL